MSDEVQEVSAEIPVPEQAATAAPETVEATPEPTEAPKVFTQEDLDAAIGKRLAQERRKFEREQQQRAQEAQRFTPPPQGDLRPEQFGSTDEYVEALATQKAAQLLQQREAQRYQSEVLATYHDKEEAARSKYEDFEQVAYNPKLTITEFMAQTIQASEVGPDVAYFLGTNPKEADRIARLSPLLQAKEIGKIEAKIASDPPAVKKTSSAPAPISPVTAKSTGAPSYDTTDPRSIKSMTTSEWIAAERQREMKRLEARQLR